MKKNRLFVLGLISFICSGCNLFSNNNKLYLKHFGVPSELISRHLAKYSENHVDLEPFDYDRGVVCEALVINTERDPFIDMVLYLSWVDKHVVFNPQSQTELTDDGWVTRIRIEQLPYVYPGQINCDFTQDGYVSVDEICFMRSGTSNTKAYLEKSNNLKVTYHEHRYDKEVASAEYLYEKGDGTHPARYYFSCACGKSCSDVLWEWEECYLGTKSFYFER